MKQGGNYDYKSLTQSSDTKALRAPRDPRMLRLSLTHLGIFVSACRYQVPELGNRIKR